MKYINKIGMMVVAGVALATTSCSDFSDYNTAVSDAQPAADNTLWENIKANPELSQFAAVLQRVGYDKILDAPTTYTVWAPVNGTFNADSINAIQKDSAVINGFVKNHISFYSHQETNAEDTVVYLLDKKLQSFNGKGTGALSFGGIELKSHQAANGVTVFGYPSTNGTLYTINGSSPFLYNAYEYIQEMEGGVADQLKEMVMKYHKAVLNEKKSVKGQIINGIQTYDSEVYDIENQLTQRIMRAELSSEDSAYTMIIPNNEAWTLAYDSISKYYNYIDMISWQNLEDNAVGATKGGSITSTTATIMKADLGKKDYSLTAAPAGSEFETNAAYMNDSITKRYIVWDLVFSKNSRQANQKFFRDEALAEKDSILSTSNGLMANASKIAEYTVAKQELSNGRAVVVNRLPWKASDVFLPEIKTRSVARVVTAPNSSYKSYYIKKEELDPNICVLDEDVERLTYVRTDLPVGSTAAPELDFYLPGVRSAAYDCYLVMVPACAEDADAEKKPYSLRVDINYTDAANKQVAATFTGEGITTTIVKSKKFQGKVFECASEKVDTVYLGRVTFPVCYYGTDAKPNIKVMHSNAAFGSSILKKYEQILRVANVILKPVDVLDELDEANKND